MKLGKPKPVVHPAERKPASLDGRSSVPSGPVNKTQGEPFTPPVNDRFTQPPEAAVALSPQDGEPVVVGNVTSKLGYDILEGAPSSVEQRLADPAATVKTVLRRFGGMSNKLQLVELSNGQRAVWRPNSGEPTHSQRPNVEVGGQAEREVAAYLLDAAMGHAAQVPPAVLRTLTFPDGTTEAGCLVAFVEGEDAGNHYFGKSAEFLHAAATRADDTLHVFDMVIGNLDRHPGNVMVDPQGQLIPIDHGLSFPNAGGAQGNVNALFFNLNEPERPLSEASLNRLQRLRAQRDAVTQALAPLLPAPALSELWSRVDRLLETGKSYPWFTQNGRFED